MSASIRRYIAQRENFQFSRGYTEAEKAANNLRIDFLKRYIINFDTNLYKTQQERDWAYIARRQYRFDVQLESAGYASMIGLVFCQWRTFVAKKMVFWPLVVVPAISYFIISPMQLQDKEDCWRSITKNCSTCATWGKISFQELKEMKYYHSAIKYFKQKISDHKQDEQNMYQKISEQDSNNIIQAQKISCRGQFLDDYHQTNIEVQFRTLINHGRKINS